VRTTPPPATQQELWLTEAATRRSTGRYQRVCLLVRHRRHGCSISTRFTTLNVITYLSLPVQPSQRPVPPSPSRIGEDLRSRLRLTSITFDDATLCSLLPDSSDVPALSVSFAIEAGNTTARLPVPPQRVLQCTSSRNQQPRATYQVWQGPILKAGEWRAQ
jgi:hypothetical protein